MHHRKKARSVSRAALAVALPEFTDLPALARDTDQKNLPEFSVATPIERKDLDGHESSARVVDLIVAARIQGGDDIEDELDDLSARIELAILEVSNLADQCLLSEVQTQSDGAAGRRIGGVYLKFQLTFWLSEPLTIT